jgi:hypothetical protein
LVADVGNEPAGRMTLWRRRIEELRTRWSLVEEARRAVDLARWRVDLETMTGTMRTLMVEGAWRVGPTDMFGVLGRA